MKKKQIILLIILIFITYNGYSQTNNENITIVGYVTDNHGNILEGVNIIDNTRKHGCTTNNKGYFEFIHKSKPDKLIFSHIGYDSKTIYISKKMININKNVCVLKIELHYKIKSLDEIKIYGNKILLAYNNKDAWILDYEFYKNKILLLIKENNTKYLRLVNFNDSVFFNKKINNKYTQLYNDCFGNIHIMAKDSIWQLYEYEKDVELLTPSSIKNFQLILKPIILSTENYFFIEQYSDFNQTVVYIRINKKSKEKKIINKLTDNVQVDYNRSYYNGYLRRLNKSNRMDSISIFDLQNIRKGINEDQFFKLILCKKTYNPLKLINDSIFIFAHNNDKIQIFDLNGIFIREMNINYHKNKFWAEEIIVDEGNSRCYAKFIKKGIVSLKEIEINTGRIINTITLEKHIFPQKIKADSNYIYYLYRNYSNESKKKYLYKQDN